MAYITVYDRILKMEWEYEKEYLIDLVQYHNKQVYLYFDEIKTDEHGFIHWDMENWCCIDGHRFICSYGNNGRIEREFGGYNIYDMDKYFQPEKASRVELA